MTDFREVQEIEQLVNSNEIFFSSQDPLASLWATYYLRDTTLLQNAASVLSQSYVHPATVNLVQTFGVSARSSSYTPKYLLIDNRTMQQEFLNGTGLLWADDIFLRPLPDSIAWSGRQYTLVSLPANQHWVLLSDIDRPNGATVDEMTTFELGPADTTIYLISGQAGTATLSGEIIYGDCVFNTDAPPALSISTDSGYSQLLPVSQNQLSLVIPVDAGQTKLTLASLQDVGCLKIKRLHLTGFESS